MPNTTSSSPFAGTTKSEVRSTGNLPKSGVTTCEASLTHSRMSSSVIAYFALPTIATSTRACVCPARAGTSTRTRRIGPNAVKLPSSRSYERKSNAWPVSSLARMPDMNCSAFGVRTRMVTGTSVFGDGCASHASAGESVDSPTRRAQSTSSPHACATSPRSIW